MNRSSLALPILFFTVSVSAHGQFVARPDPSSNPISQAQASKDQILAARAMAALKRLEREVLVYRSLKEFEENGKLARVSFDTFRNDLQAVTAEVEPLLTRLPKSKLKTEITNALDSYRDGAWWWQKIDQPRVVRVSSLTFSEPTRSPTYTSMLANVPYTVVIHWRQAEKYLNRAERLMNFAGK